MHYYLFSCAKLILFYYSDFFLLLKNIKIVKYFSFAPYFAFLFFSSPYFTTTFRLPMMYIPEGRDCEEECRCPVRE